MQDVKAKTRCTVAQKCYGNISFTHSNFNLLTAIIISILLTAISICSRQFQSIHGNFNLLFWLICQTKEKLEQVLKACFLDFINAFLSCVSSQNYIAKSGTIDGNQHVSFWLLNEKFVDRRF